MESERQRMKDEYKRMRSDPLYGATGQFFFADTDDVGYILIAQSGEIKELIKRTKKANIDYVLQRVPHL